MIDFRYHLISLTAVILALALGIMAGSGFLGGPLLESLRNDLDQLRAERDEVRAEISALQNRNDQMEQFARLAAPYLTSETLAGRDIVVVQFGGSEGGLIDGIKSSLTDAGARIATEITMTEKFALTNQPARDELAIVLESAASEAGPLRTETATLLGERLADAGSRIPNEGPVDAADEQALNLLTGLERSDFVGLADGDDDDVIPTGALFVLIAGSRERPPYEVGQFAEVLSEVLAEVADGVMVVEPVDSQWLVVQQVRDDVEARSVVATVDNGETTIGRIAAVLGLGAAVEGRVGHYGFAPGMSVLPESQSGP